MQSDVPTHEPGEIFGPYRLERRLGRGAAAEVWLAVEEGELGFTKRQALKLLRPPPGEMETQKKALINEARVCGRLKHPGVVDVYRVGAHSGELFIAMEFVDGPDLDTLLETLRRRGAVIPVGVAIEAAIDLCEALDHAHTATSDDGETLAVVHRDLKPSNVLVDRRGLLKISDWGLVKSTLNIESTTRGIVKGTPGYIAPEVWGGTRDFRPAADLFAVGAMLYEMIVGARLFQGRNLARIAEQVARRTGEEEAAEVRERAPDVEPILARALQRIPSQRHQSAAELAAALRAVRENYPAGETLKKFLRSCGELLNEIAPPVRSTGRSKPGAAGSDLDLDDSGVDLEQPPAPGLAGAPGADEPTGEYPTPAGTLRGKSPGNVAPTRAMAPSEVAAEALRQTDPPPALAPREPIAPPPSPSPSTSGASTSGAPSPAPPSARKPGPRRSRGAADSKPARRPPPPTGAVVVAISGILLLALGLAAYFLMP